MACVGKESFNIPLQFLEKRTFMLNEQTGKPRQFLMIVLLNIKICVKE